MKDYLLDLLLDLDGIEQDSYYHPEGDALFHSLQVFQLAHQQSDFPVMWAAALFHDVGKANDSKNHDAVGAEMLQGVLNAEMLDHQLHEMRQIAIKVMRELSDFSPRLIGSVSIKRLTQGTSYLYLGQLFE